MVVLKGEMSCGFVACIDLYGMCRRVQMQGELLQVTYAEDR